MEYTRRRWMVAAAALAGVGVAGCSRRQASRGRPVPPGATVLALGDSLTAGTGATPETSYPAVLAELTGWNVVNAGVPGDTAAQALDRLPALLAQHKPALVLVGIGGNDLLRRHDEAVTRSTIHRIVRVVWDAGAQAMLLAVPRPTLASRVTDSLDDHPMYGEIAERMGVLLQRRGWSEVLQDPSLRADDIHANAAGYRRYAESVKATAFAAGLLEPSAAGGRRPG